MDDPMENPKSQDDSFVDTLKPMDSRTAVERDCTHKLLVNDGYKLKDDTETANKTLEILRRDFSLVTNIIEDYARQLDKEDKEEEEKQPVKTLLDDMYEVLKKPHTIETSVSHSNCLGSLQPNEKGLNNTEELSDISCSSSENSSCKNMIQFSKPNPPAPMKKCSASNTLNDVNTKTIEIKNMNVNGGQNIAKTTVTMDLGHVSAKSVIKPLTQQTTTTKSSSSSVSVKALSSNELENDLNQYNTLNTNIEKEHNFINKTVLLPETCGQCQKKLKMYGPMVKCISCKASAHLECKHLIPATCKLTQYQRNALNSGIPPFIVHCILEVERRGLNTIGLYRKSSSDKEMQILRKEFLQSVLHFHEIDIHVLCSCIKDFIHKKELISKHDMSKLIDALKKNDADSKSLRQVVCELPSNNLSILAFLILHLQKVVKSPKCNMDNNSLAIAFERTLSISSISSSDSQFKSEVIVELVTELLMLPKDFWLDLIKADSSPLARNQRQTTLYLGTLNHFFSSSRSILLNSPEKHELAKPVDFKDTIESSE